jgi:hypothetical protein
MDQCKEIIKKYFKTHFQNELNSLLFCKKNPTLLSHKTNELFLQSFNMTNIKVTENNIINEIQKSRNFNASQKQQYTEMVESEFRDMNRIKQRFDLEVRIFLDRH